MTPKRNVEGNFLNVCNNLTNLFLALVLAIYCYSFKKYSILFIEIGTAIHVNNLHTNLSLLIISLLLICNLILLYSLKQLIFQHIFPTNFVSIIQNAAINFSFFFFFLVCSLVISKDVNSALNSPRIQAKIDFNENMKVRAEAELGKSKVVK